MVLLYFHSVESPQSQFISLSSCMLGQVKPNKIKKKLDLTKLSLPTLYNVLSPSLSSQVLVPDLECYSLSQCISTRSLLDLIPVQLYYVFEYEVPLPVYLVLAPVCYVQSKLQVLFPDPECFSLSQCISI